MKRILILFAVIVFLIGCSDSDGDGVVEIRDRFFITQVMDIHINADEYVGRTIRYEGIFLTTHWAATGEDYHQVIRYVDDCCGDGGIIGFMIYLGDIEPLPDDAWVEVTGVLEWFEIGGFRFPRLAAVSVTEMSERGEEIVSS